MSDFKPNDACVQRIAKALAEGCDGRSFASDDAKYLSVLYQRHRDATPDKGFGECRDAAFADFICEVLNKPPF